MRSIVARTDEAGRSNIVAPPLRLDLAHDSWSTAVSNGEVDAIVAINVCHIAPWSVTCGLLRSAGALLVPGGLLAIYGPFKRGGEHTAPSNAAFDASLRSRNDSWGVRDVGDLERQATSSGLALCEAHAMPSNNFLLELRPVRP